MIHAGNILAMHAACGVRFEHRDTLSEGHVQWIEDNVSALPHEKHHPGRATIMLSTDQRLNDLPKTSFVETL